MTLATWSVALSKVLQGHPVSYTGLLFVVWCTLFISRARDRIVCVDIYLVYVGYSSQSLYGLRCLGYAAEGIFMPIAFVLCSYDMKRWERKCRYFPM